MDINAGQSRKSLHVSVSDDCINSCIFCVDGRVDGKTRNIPTRIPTLTEIESELCQGYEAGLREVWFVSGEPTLNPQLPEIVSLSRELGFQTIGMNTNGRRLGRERLLERLVSSGLNNLVISIHGDRPEIHDRLVGRTGAFAEVLLGLERIRHLPAKHRPRITWLCVLNRENLPHVEAIYRSFLKYLSPASGDLLSFTCIKMFGCAVKAFEQVGMQYVELVGGWIEAWRRLGAPGEMVLSEVPGCVIAARSGADQPLPAIDVPDEFFGLDADEPGTEGISSPIDRRYRKRSACRKCLLEPICFGVLKHYISRYGWEEFPPVLQVPPRLKRPGSLPDPKVRETNPKEGEAHESSCLVLGISPDSMKKAGLNAGRIHFRDGTVQVTIESPDDPAFEIHIEPRNESSPAFARTRYLNISYRSPSFDRRVCWVISQVCGNLEDVRFEDIVGDSD